MDNIYKKYQSFNSIMKLTSEQKKQYEYLFQDKLAVFLTWGAISYSVRQDYDDAFRHLSRIEEFPHIHQTNSSHIFQVVLYFLGCCYYYGRGTDQNYSRAFQCWKKGADTGNKLHQNLCGICCCCGIGTQRNYEEAFLLFQKAADQDLSDALFNLAILYQNGWGIPKSKKTAQQFLHKAADLEHQKAKKELKLSVNPFWKLTETSFCCPNSLKIFG